MTVLGNEFQLSVYSLLDFGLTSINEQFGTLAVSMVDEPSRKTKRLDDVKVELMICMLKSCEVCSLRRLTESDLFFLSR
jgi:hypothetical protein